MAVIKKNNKSKIMRIYQIAVSIILLGLLYYLKFPLYYIGIMAVLILLLIFLKGKLYRKIESFMDKVLPFLARLNPTVRKIIIILIFILFWILLKQIIFFGLKLAGIDMQKIIYESMNQSMIGSGSSSSGGPGA